MASLKIDTDVRKRCGQNIPLRAASRCSGSAASVKQDFLGAGHLRATCTHLRHESKASGGEMVIEREGNFYARAIHNGKARCVDGREFV